METTHLDSNPLFTAVFVPDNPTPDLAEGSFAQASFGDDDLIEVDVRQVLDLCVDKRRTVELVVKNVSIAQNQMFTRMQIAQRCELKVRDRNDVFVEFLVSSVSINY